VKLKKKWLGLFGLGIVGCAIGGGYYYYQQLTYLPDWYEAENEFQEFNPKLNSAASEAEVLATDTRTDNQEINQIKQELQAILDEHNRALASSPPAETESSESINPASQSPEIANPTAENRQQDFSAGLSQQTLVDATPQTNSPATPRFDPKLSPTLPKRDINVTLNQGQIRQIIGEDRELSEKNRAFLESTQGVRANINQDQLQLGAVVSVSDLPLDVLDSQKRRLAEKVLQSNPALRSRSVYVSLDSNYEIENGQIQINGNTQVSVGNMRFSLQEISQRSGVSQSQIERLINQQLNRQLRYLQNLPQ
jgi:hypothetical protein